MKYLIVKPQGGLANRIRVMEAAYNYSRSMQIPMTVVWEKNHALNADYEVCFTPIEGVKVVNADYNGTSVFSKFKRGVFNSIEAAGLSFYTLKTLNDPDIFPMLNNDAPTEKSKDYFDSLATSEKGLFIETCYEFYPNLLNFGLGIQAGIKQRAHQLLEKYPSLIGIHIRRTDNADAIKRSPLQRFSEEIDSILQDSPSTSFYLSTDAEDVVQELRKRYNGKIVTGITVRSRESTEGIVSALIDMYCLSQCRKILGSFRSTFSERAAIIGKIPLQIIST